MVIEYNKKIKVVSPKLHFHGGKPKPNPTLAKPNPNPQQVHLHEKVDPNQHSTICNPELKPSLVLDTTNPQSKPIHSPDICPSPHNPPQDVDKSDLSESTSITTNLNETCSLDTSCDRLLHLDSPSLSSELQDTSSVGSVEIEFVPVFEEPLESDKFSPRDVFSVQHEYDLSLLIQEIYTPSDNLNHQDTHVCEKQGQDDFLIHATDLSHNFALPQFMAHHNWEDLEPIDTPSTCSTFTQASSDHTSNPGCTHNSMVTQCNQSQSPPC